MPYRTLCDILEEMRKCYKTRNFSYIMGLIEEGQSAGQRMEAALWDQHGVTGLREERKKLKQEIKDLEQTVDKLKQEKKGK